MGVSVRSSPPQNSVQEVGGGPTKVSTLGAGLAGSSAVVTAS